jgi:hypothetical protein
LTDDAWSNPTGATRVIALMVPASIAVERPGTWLELGRSMSQWALPAIAVMLIAYGAVSGRLRSTPVSQAMVFVALGHLVGNRVLDLVEADTANQFARHLAEAGVSWFDLRLRVRGLATSGAVRWRSPLRER